MAAARDIGPAGPAPLGQAEQEAFSPAASGLLLLGAVGMLVVKLERRCAAAGAAVRPHRQDQPGRLRLTSQIRSLLVQSEFEPTNMHIELIVGIVLAPVIKPGEAPGSDLSNSVD